MAIEKYNDKDESNTKYHNKLHQKFHYVVFFEAVKAMMSQKMEYEEVCDTKIFCCTLDHLRDLTCNLNLQ